MQKAFLNKIFKAKFFDTKKYRYVALPKYSGESKWMMIQRLPIGLVNTEASADQSNWETVGYVK